MGTKPTASAALPKGGVTHYTVICKIPQGIVIQLHKMEKVREVIPGGSRDTDMAKPIDGKAYLIKGPAHFQNEGPRVRMAGGFAINEDVPGDLWEAWMEQSGKYLAACQNGLLQGFPNTGVAVDAAKESRKTITGLERIDPNNIPVTDTRFKLETAAEQVAEIVHPVEE